MNKQIYNKMIMCCFVCILFLLDRYLLNAVLCLYMTLVNT